LSLTGIVVNGQTYALSTGDYELSGKSRTGNTAKKVGGGAAVGALIGAVVGGGKGAAIGAGVGAGAGTAVQVATQGEQVHVPSETLLEFALDQPVTIPITHAR
jgi:outer membrane lipoprotein SlyB